MSDQTLQQKVFLDRYALRDETGQPIETSVEQMWRRVARGLAEVEPEEHREKHERQFYNALKDFKFVPGGRILHGAGTGHAVTFYNCYVIPSPHDSRHGIFENVRLMADIMARGGGVGVNLSSLRPRGSYIKSVNGSSSGPVSWAQIYSVTTGDVIQQGGSRRGALMLMLDDWHPDVEEFISKKSVFVHDQETGANRPRWIEYANVSVCASDAFMEAVEYDREWVLEYPATDHPAYQTEWDGDLPQWKAKGYATQVHKKLPARAIWERICESAHRSAEPGVVFMERYQNESNSGYFERIRCVNPCVTGGTPVLTPTGWVRADAINVGDEICTIEGVGRVESIETHEDVEVFRVHFSDGGFVDATAAHRFHCSPGSGTPFTTPRLDEIGPGWVVRFGPRRPHRDSSGVLYHGPSDWWCAEVLSIEPIGRARVYDLYEPTTDTWITNGYVSRGCGEQGLGPFAVCNLGALNLAAFVNTDGTFDFSGLAKATKTAVRMLDNVIEATPYFLPENEQNQRVDIRRIGLGTMGFADALLKMKLAYGAEESLPVVESIYRVIRDAAYSASADLAAEMGSFGKFDAEEYLRRPFVERLPQSIRDKIAAHGIRNALLLTQAPTGTTSLLAGVSSGIEPVFDFAMKRTDRLGTHLMYHPMLESWRASVVAKGQDPDAVKPPDYFVSSADLTPEDHVRVQAAIQKYTDSSISKTVNAPASYTPSDVDRLYRFAYASGCKGITVYVDGSRDAVLHRVKDDAKPVKLERPVELTGRTRKVRTPFGSINVTVNDLDGQPFESFILVSKGGTELQAAAEAIGRLVSQHLRTAPSDRKEALREVAEQLRGIGGSGSFGFGPNKVVSLPDAVALAYQQMFPVEAELSTDEPGVKSAPSLDICPECGGASLARQEGCQKCMSCGYSRC